MKISQPSFSRRSFLKAGAALGANPHVVGMKGAVSAAAQSILAPLPQIDPSVLNPLLVDDIVGAAQKMLFSLFIPKKEEDSFRLYHGYHDNFYSFSLGAVRLLALNPKERAAVFNRPEFASIKSQIDPKHLISNPEQLLDDSAIINRIYFLWDRLHDNTSDESLSYIGNYQSDRLKEWRQTGFIEKHPPAWWHSCTKRERLHVWLECLHAEEFGVPLGYFVKDDDRLMDIIFRNLYVQIPSESPLFGVEMPFPELFTRIRTPAFFQSHFGPETWQQHFTRSHELLLRATGMPKEAAQRQAQDNLANANREPPLISVERINNGLLARPNRARYRVKLTALLRDDFTALFTAYEHIFGELTHTSRSRKISWKLRFTQDGGFAVSVPLNDTTKELMDRFCLDCFHWDRGWVREYGAAFELEPNREPIQPKELAVWNELKFRL